MPKSKNKVGSSKKNEPAHTESERKPAKRRWYHVVLPFLLFLFVFGGTDALLLRDVVAFATALFFVISLQWKYFLPLNNRRRETAVTTGLIIGYFAAVLYMTPPVDIGYDTTYISEPKTADGKRVDYFKAVENRVFRSGVAENNGFDLLEPITADHFPPLKLPLKQRSRVSAKPWTKEEFPEVETWLTQNTNMFKLLEEAVKDRPFAAPMLRHDEGQPLSTTPQQLGKIRSLIDKLPIKIGYELGKQTPEGSEQAWNDCVLQFKYAEQFAKYSYDQLGLSYAYVQFDQACDTAVSIVWNDSMTPEKLKTMLETREISIDMPGNDVLKNLIYTQRLGVLDHLQAFAEGRAASQMDTETTEREVNQFDRFRRFFHWNEAMRKVNGYFDWLETGSGDALRSVKSSESQIGDIIKVGFFRAIPDKYAQNVVNGLIDQNKLFEQKHRQAKAKAALLKCVLYLEMYRVENPDGLYPESWDELLAKFPSQIPDDPCNVDRPFVYGQMHERRGYLLYSIGPNGIDDGGTAWSDDRKSDDIAYRREP